MPLLAQSVADLAAAPAVRAGLEWFRRERAWINDQHLKLCRIPAPTFFEEKRAAWMMEQFRALGWDAAVDRAGNVVATLPDSGDLPLVAVTAHLDTVFAPRSSEEIRVSGDGRFLGPGTSDNGAGLAALLALAAAWIARPPFEDLEAAPVLVANVGEEGEGNLSGMRHFCRGLDLGDNSSKIRGFLVLDGPGVEHITSRALASRRFEIAVTGPGGHSWRDSERGNPVHALTRAVARFINQAGGDDAGEALPGPRTTFNFGIIDGGSSINSIPTEARAKVDLRSESAQNIDRLAALLAVSVERAAEIENARSAAGRVAARITEIGSRPSGALADDAPILEGLRAVDAFLGIRSRAGLLVDRR